MVRMRHLVADHYVDGSHLKFRLNCSQLCSDEEIKRIAASSSEEAFFPLKRYSRGMIFAITVAGSFISFNLNCRTLGEVDTVPAGYLAWGLLHGKGFDLTPYAGDPEQLGKYIGDAILPGKNGRYVSKSPPGSAVSAIPVYTVASVLTNSIPTRSHMNTLGKQAAALYCALAVGFFMIIVTRLFPTAAVPATILFALGTTLWSTASQALWMHGPATFCVCLGLWFLLCPREALSPREAFWAGLCLGLGVACRPTVAILLLCVVLALAIGRKWKLVLGLCLGCLAPLAALGLYNIHYTGSLGTGGYGEEAFRWGTPLWLGLAGLTVAPSRGLFFFTPASVLALVGTYSLLRRSPAMQEERRLILVGANAGAAFTIILYAKWWGWHGGWSYGPRFLTEIMPIVCLMFAVAYSQLPKPRMRWLAAALVALSVFTHALGVFGHYSRWNARHYLGPYATDLFCFKDNQISACLYRAITEPRTLIGGKSVEDGAKTRQDFIQNSDGRPPDDRRASPLPGGQPSKVVF